ncbi:hypothetical protein IE53DRAFT_370443 [Violaceomyces palustris]|uniref:Uncharacterized protein n=1 Tax=Violaceomyces palustris TaxID=1673888 RepID=A0ACD0NS41_9BASI|nr:hypothetical protein IE53DRAFT_370443 [Violaceomyces palustris]
MMQTQAASPIPIISSASPTHAAGTFDSPSHQSNVKRAGDGGEQSVTARSRRQSRYDMLSELLLPDLALSVDFSSMNLSKEGKWGDHDPSSCNSYREATAAKVKRIAARLGEFKVKDLLPYTKGASTSTVSIDGTIEEACEILSSETDGDCLLVIQAEAEQKSFSKELVTAGDCFGFFSYADLHTFLSLLFCPNQTSSSEPDEARMEEHGLTSPPPSPRANMTRSVTKETGKMAEGKSNAEPDPSSLPAEKCMPRAEGASDLHADIIRKAKNGEKVTMSLVTNLIYLFAQESLTKVVVAGSSDTSGLAGPVLGIVTEKHIVEHLVKLSCEDPELSATFDEKIEDLTAEFSPAPPVEISCDKTVMDAMALMTQEKVSSLAVIDARGFLLSALGSSEVAFLVMKSDSKKILTTNLASFVKALRSQRPEGIEGKDAHPALSVGLESTLGRATAILLAASATGLYTVDDRVAMMTPPLTATSPSSPGREPGWRFSDEFRTRSDDLEKGGLGAAALPASTHSRFSSLSSSLRLPKPSSAEAGSSVSGLNRSLPSNSSLPPSAGTWTAATSQSRLQLPKRARSQSMAQSLSSHQGNTEAAATSSSSMCSSFSSIRQPPSHHQSASAGQAAFSEPTSWLNPGRRLSMGANSKRHSISLSTSPPSSLHSSIVQSSPQAQPVAASFFSSDSQTAPPLRSYLSLTDIVSIFAARSGFEKIPFVATSRTAESQGSVGGAFGGHDVGRSARKRRTSSSISSGSFRGGLSVESSSFR